MATPKQLPVIPEPPAYLTGDLAEAYRKIAPECYRTGMLSEHDRDLLAKYVIAEQSCTFATGKFRSAMSAGDVKNAEKWLTVQDKLVKQSLLLAAELGLTPNSRKAKGITR